MIQALCAGRRFICASIPRDSALHWADVASLRLLQLVASEAGSCRLLALGLYRGSDAYPRAEVAACCPGIRGPFIPARN